MARIFSFLLILFFSAVGCYSQDKTQGPFSLLEKRGDSSNTSLTGFTFDFGQAKEGQILKHNFTLKNETKKVLNIKDVNTSCGCTGSNIKKKTLKANETTLIEVRLDTKGYSGQIQQFVYVHTDNLDNPIFKFIIKAYVIK